MLNGNPVGLDEIEDETLKDLLSWMLNLKPEDRPYSNEALKHPFLMSDDEKFEMLSKVGNLQQIKSNDPQSSVVQKLNSESVHWKSQMDCDVYDCLVNGRPYRSSWTECLRLIRNVHQHWNDRPRPLPQPEPFYKIGDYRAYFLRTFPNLPVRSLVTRQSYQVSSASYAVMERVLRQQRFDTNPNAQDIARSWLHWFATFQNFVAAIPNEEVNKLKVLVNYVSADVYQLFCEATTYEEAIELLKNLYVKVHNEIFSRHKLATRKQQSGESLDEYLQELKSLSKDCNFRSVTSNQYRDEAVRDAFIAGLLSTNIRQRLLENKTLDIQTAFDQARALDTAQRTSETYADGIPITAAALSNKDGGNSFINQRAFENQDKIDQSDGHQENNGIERVCKSVAPQAYIALAPTKHTVAKSLKKACIGVLINGKSCEALIDSGSTHNFIHPKVASNLGLNVYTTQEKVTMAASLFSSKIQGYCLADIILKEREYTKVKLFVLANLCTNVILGQNWQEKHENIIIEYGGKSPSLTICGLSTINIEPPPLFQFLSEDCRPVAAKSRRYSAEDRAFIAMEVSKLIEEGIIEEIGRLSDAKNTVNAVAQYSVFSTVDLKSAYHQVPIKNKERKYTAFEANNRLYQFRKILFGVTNGAAAFQRSMDTFISEEALEDTFAYLDNITICGYNQEHHDKNLELFMKTARKRNLTFNESKCVFSVTSISILGSVVSQGEIKPDPERLKPLRELPAPRDAKAQRRVIGLFSYYSQWIKDFSTKIRPLSHNLAFPLSNDALQAFDLLKNDIENAVVGSIDESYPFQIETDASEFALSATLNQQGRPVAFFSRALNGSELKHSSVERKQLLSWRPFVGGNII
ncbi:uncharacterized protein LOC124449011 [Xenia sp. Carnegie-2017]|uniref:uncharacterized protein LOC124449011 n=1 Tax=Xenia sp. Carnegie-2017 TaxID=2897299 RepID=UPI001F04F108|nr:uncharacterized protein LOC124449011 [Xenia sp. Carnegie-2017]